MWDGQNVNWPLSYRKAIHATPSYCADSAEGIVAVCYQHIWGGSASIISEDQRNAKVVVDYILGLGYYICLSIPISLQNKTLSILLFADTHQYVWHKNDSSKKKKTTFWQCQRPKNPLLAVRSFLVCGCHAVWVWLCMMDDLQQLIPRSARIFRVVCIANLTLFFADKITGWKEFHTWSDIWLSPI